MSWETSGGRELLDLFFLDGKKPQQKMGVKSWEESSTKSMGDRVFDEENSEVSIFLDHHMIRFEGEIV